MARHQRSLLVHPHTPASLFQVSPIRRSLMLGNLTLGNQLPQLIRRRAIFGDLGISSEQRSLSPMHLLPRPMVIRQATRLVLCRPERFRHPHPFFRTLILLLSIPMLNRRLCSQAVLELPRRCNPVSRWGSPTLFSPGNQPSGTRIRGKPQLGP